MVTQKHVSENRESTGWKIGAVIATALATAIITAIVSLVVNFFEHRRTNELQFVSSQIEKLYGPLFALREASVRSFDAWKTSYWPGRADFFDPNYQIKPEDIEIRRRWMDKVFQPINIRMKEVLVNNSHLLIGQRMPPMFLQLIAHTEAYKTVMAKWEFNSSSADPEYLTKAANVSPVAYPPRLNIDPPYNLDFTSCIKQQYDALRQQQEALRRSFWTVLWDTPPTIPTVCGEIESAANSEAVSK
jgi:hypothetical protein